MTPEEKNLISGLFDRLRTSDTAAKDKDALQLIQSLAASQPASPYLLVQTVLVQEHALQNAQARIAQLEHQLADAASRASAPAQPSGGGFLSGLLHPKPAASAAPPPVPAAYAQPAPPPVPPYPSTIGMPPSAGGGFLRGALSTAAGVAGGALLFQGIENLLGHHAGPFGSGLSDIGSVGGGMGGGGFLGQTGTENVEVINNNFYETDAADRVGGQSFLPAEQDYSAPANQDDSTDFVTNDDQNTSDDTYSGDDAGTDSGGGDNDSLA